MTSDPALGPLPDEEADDGNTELERFAALTKRLVRVPKEEIDKARAAEAAQK